MHTTMKLQIRCGECVQGQLNMNDVEINVNAYCLAFIIEI